MVRVSVSVRFWVNICFTAPPPVITLLRVIATANSKPNPTPNHNPNPDRPYDNPHAKKSFMWDSKANIYQVLCLLIMNLHVQHQLWLSLFQNLPVII